MRPGRETLRARWFTASLIVLCSLIMMGCLTKSTNNAGPELDVLPQQFKDRFADVVNAVSQNTLEGLPNHEGATATCSEGFKRVDRRSSLGACGFGYRPRGESAPPESSVSKVNFAITLWPDVASAKAAWEMMKGSDEQPFFLNPAGIGEESFIISGSRGGLTCELLSLLALDGVTTLTVWAQYCGDPPTEYVLQIARLLLAVKP
jgi:hypothetical protein